MSSIVPDESSLSLAVCGIVDDVIVVSLELDAIAAIRSSISTPVSGAASLLLVVSFDPLLSLLVSLCSCTVVTLIDGVDAFISLLGCGDTGGDAVVVDDAILSVAE